jgi:glucokinase
MVAARVEDTCVIGVDLGGTKILAGVVERDGSVASRVERASPVSSQDDLLAALDEVVEELLGDGVAAVGFGIPSRIDQVHGRVVSSVHLPLADLDFRGRMQERFGLPVAIENDAQAATIAEWQLGAGRGARHMVMLTLGTGVGGGLILDGKPYRGSIGAGGELGHIVIEYGGPRCLGDCVGHGHLEYYASGSAADRAAHGLYGDEATGRDLVTRARAGEDAAIDALGEIGRYLGAGIGSLVNVFNPELVVIGGGLSVAGDLVLGPAREAMIEEAVSPSGEMVKVVLSELGPDAGLVGAGLVAFEALESAAG